MAFLFSCDDMKYVNLTQIVLVQLALGLLFWVPLDIKEEKESCSQEKVKTSNNMPPSKRDTL